jgi:TadE-like protein
VSRQHGKQLKKTSDLGATLVEFAVIFPLLLLLLFGVIEFGRLITTIISVSTASREGARFGTAIGETTPGTPQYIDCAGIVDAARSKVVIGRPTASEVIVVWDEGPGTTPIADCDGATVLPAPNVLLIESGHRVSVTVQKQFGTGIPLISNFIGTLNLESTDNRTIFKGVLSG